MNSLEGAKTEEEKRQLRKLRIGRKMKYINLFQLNAGSSSANPISDSILYLSSINPRKLQLKVMFPNPEIVSLSS